MAWANLADARKHWSDATAIPDDTLTTLLAAAQTACEAYAPAGVVEPVPAGYMLAVVYQAREIRAAVLRGESDVIGIGEYAIRARPLTAAVKALLRPATGRPRFGPPVVTP